MIPPKTVKLVDKRGEKVVKELMDDLYSKLGSFSKKLTTVEGVVSSLQSPPTTVADAVELTYEQLQDVIDTYGNVGGLSIYNWNIQKDVYLDQYDGLFTEKNAVLTIRKLWEDAPGGLYFTQYVETVGLGDAATAIGVGGLKLIASDKAGIAAGSRGILQPLRIEVGPIQDRSTPANDEASPVTIKNTGTKKATYAFSVEDNAPIVGSQWDDVFHITTDADALLMVTGTYTDGIDLSGMTLTNGALKLANLHWLQAKDAAGTFKNLMQMTAADKMSFYNGALLLQADGDVEPLGDILLASGKVLKINSVTVLNGQAAHIADASIAHNIAVTDPLDSPASVDALRDDLVTNTLASLKTSVNGALDALGTKVNAIISALEGIGPFASS